MMAFKVAAGVRRNGKLARMELEIVQLLAVCATNIEDFLILASSRRIAEVSIRQ